jgi:hypothetical protein
MRRFVRSLLAGTAMLGVAAVAQADPIPFEGTLSLQLGSLPSLVVSGTGVGTVNGSGGLGHLNSMTLGPNGMYGTATIPLTDPANPTLVSLVGTFDLIEPGVFANISGGPPGGGVMPVSGLFRLCILAGPGCPFSIAIPLTVNGTRGVGIGGMLTVNGFAKAGIQISITGNPWTIGTAAITGIPTDNGGFTTSTAAGFAHGPQSLTSSTANPSGVVQLVTPVLVQTNLKGNEVIALFGTLMIHFTPEPGTLLLFGAGLAGLAVVSRRTRVR